MSTQGAPRTVVILPTYRRPEALVWSLTSVLRQRIAPACGSARVVVVNNDPGRAPVDAAVSEAVRQCPGTAWQVDIFHREKTIDPIESMYDGIARFSVGGDFVFLHGDDDILLPGSIAKRVDELAVREADLLLSRSIGGLYLDMEAERACVTRSFFRSLRNNRWISPGPLDIGLYDSYGPAFMGGQAYRNTMTFWKAYERALARMRLLPIFGQQQIAMLPFFLGLDVQALGGLVATTTAMCLRGITAKDAFRTRFGQNNWRPGVLYAACLYLFERSDLKARTDLAPVIAEYRRQVSGWIPISMLSSETRKPMSELLVGARWRIWHLDAPRFLRGMRSVLTSVVGLQALKTRLLGLEPNAMDKATFFTRLEEFAL